MRAFLVSRKEEIPMKRPFKEFEKIYEAMLFDYFNSTLFVYISVYYIYYYTYLYLYILSNYTIYILYKIVNVIYKNITYCVLSIKFNVNNTYNIFFSIFELFGILDPFKHSHCSICYTPKTHFRWIKTVRFSKLIKENTTC